MIMGDIFIQEVSDNLTRLSVYVLFIHKWQLR